MLTGLIISVVWMLILSFWLDTVRAEIRKLKAEIEDLKFENSVLIDKLIEDEKD